MTFSKISCSLISNQLFKHGKASSIENRVRMKETLTIKSNLVVETTSFRTSQEDGNILPNSIPKLKHNALANDPF